MTAVIVVRGADGRPYRLNRRPIVYAAGAGYVAFFLGLGDTTRAGGARKFFTAIGATAAEAVWNAKMQATTARRRAAA